MANVDGAGEGGGLERRLDVIGRATVAIAGERSLPALLQRIVETAREVTGAAYGALGVAGEGGTLVEFITAGLNEAERARIGDLPVGHGLLGLILGGDTPVRVRDIGADPRAHGFPPHHPPMTSFLGAPILLGGRNLGNLYLTEKRDAAEFTEEDERLIVVLAAHAAVAIDGAHLYARTREALEARVRELHAANDQLQRLTSQVIDAQEEERRRIARELHDDTAQSLTSLLVHLRLLERRTAADDQRAALAELRAQAAAAIEGVRRLARDLRPSTLDDLGLVPAVESFVREFAERWPLAARLHIQGERRRLAPALELIVYRVVQEALTNVAKHARATAADVVLRFERDHLIVTVRDDGRGFAVDETLRSRERGLGLFGMRERAQLAGGYLDVQSAPGAGATVTLVAPARAAEEER